MKTLLLSCAYLPPVSYMAAVVRSPSLLLDGHSYYEKQSYRNRASIYGANGLLNLVVPVRHRQLYRTPVREVRIASDEAWHTLHWRSIESAYRNSPFFEFFEDRLRPLFQHPQETLFAQDLVLLETCLSLLGCGLRVSQTMAYQESYGEDILDLRAVFHPKRKGSTRFPVYPQVFQQRAGFLQDLSILDLLFNCGTQSLDYLRSLPLKGISS